MGHNSTTLKKTLQIDKITQIAYVLSLI